jgi:hypothetical protein
MTMMGGDKTMMGGDMTMMGGEKLQNFMLDLIRSI